MALHNIEIDMTCDTSEALRQLGSDSFRRRLLQHFGSAGESGVCPKKFAELLCIEVIDRGEAIGVDSCGTEKPSEIIELRVSFDESRVQQLV